MGQGAHIRVALLQAPFDRGGQGGRCAPIGGFLGRWPSLRSFWRLILQLLQCPAGLLCTAWHRPLHLTAMTRQAPLCQHMEEGPSHADHQHNMGRTTFRPKHDMCVRQHLMLTLTSQAA